MALRELYRWYSETRAPASSSEEGLRQCCWKKECSNWRSLVWSSRFSCRTATSRPWRELGERGWRVGGYILRTSEGAVILVGGGRAWPFSLERTLRRTL